MNITLPLRSEWDDMRCSVMQIALLNKFQQNEDIKILLLATDNRLLLDTSPYDYYWGSGENGTGLNTFGQCIMETRDTLCV